MKNVWLCCITTVAVVAVRAPSVAQTVGDAAGCVRPAEKRMERLLPQRLVGEYRLVLVVEAGTAPSRQASGSLSLRELPDSLIHVADEGLYRRVRRVVGWTDLDVSLVGAATEYSPTSTDPRRPGVDVVVDRRGTVRHLTLGRPPGMLDGLWFALRVTALDSTGFRGRWTFDLLGSGTRGHFCAIRIAGGP